MNTSARQPFTSAPDFTSPPIADVALRILRFALVVPRQPAQDVAIVVRHQDRQFAAERRDLVLEVERIALVGPEKDFEDILRPKVLEVLLELGREFLVGRVHEHVKALLGIEHLHLGVVGQAFRLAAMERNPLGRVPVLGVAKAIDFEVVSWLHLQLGGPGLSVLGLRP